MDFSTVHPERKKKFSETDKQDKMLVLCANVALFIKEKEKSDYFYP